MGIQANNKSYRKNRKLNMVSGAEAKPDVSIIGLKNKRNSVLG